MVLNGENVRKIHKRIYEITIKTPKIFLFMSKVANKSVKTIDRRKNMDDNAELLLILFSKMDYNGKIKRLINHETMEYAEKRKHEVIDKYIKNSESSDKWLYLASSHSDCAEDHKDWQGKIYYDSNAPAEVIRYAHNHGYRSLQWVMGGPVWFITRPNCRHFFRSLDFNTVKQYSIKELQRRYKTHRMTGDRTLATPAKVAVDEYTDKVRMLRAMYREHQTERLRREIQKTELLLKKWKKIL